MSNWNREKFRATLKGEKLEEVGTLNTSTAELQETDIAQQIANSGQP